MNTTKISIISSILVIILIQSCASIKNKNNRNDLQKENISGNVKSIKQLFYDYNEEVDSVETFIIRKFNKLGYVIEVEMHQYDGSTYYYSYKFDHKNDVIEQREYNTNKTLVATKTYTHKYNEKGDKVEIKEFDESG